MSKRRLRLRRNKIRAVERELYQHVKLFKLNQEFIGFWMQNLVQQVDKWRN